MRHFAAASAHDRERLAVPRAPTAQDRHQIAVPAAKSHTDKEKIVTHRAGSTHDRGELSEMRHNFVAPSAHDKHRMSTPAAKSVQDKHSVVTHDAKSAHDRQEVALPKEPTSQDRHRMLPAKAEPPLSPRTADVAAARALARVPANPFAESAKKLAEAEQEQVVVSVLRRYEERPHEQGGAASIDLHRLDHPCACPPRSTRAALIFVVMVQGVVVPAVLFVVAALLADVTGYILAIIGFLDFAVVGVVVYRERGPGRSMEYQLFPCCVLPSTRPKDIDG